MAKNGNKGDAFPAREQSPDALAPTADGVSNDGGSGYVGQEDLFIQMGKADASVIRDMFTGTVKLEEALLRGRLPREENENWMELLADRMLNRKGVEARKEVQAMIMRTSQGVRRPRTPGDVIGRTRSYNEGG